MSASTQTSPFFCLRLEIRLEILSYILPLGNNAGLILNSTPNHSFTSLYTVGDRFSASLLLVLLTCK